MDFDNEEFKKLKNEIENEYQSIGSIYSPALKAEIFFNSNGWHHLRYDQNRSERSKIIQKNKLIFFKDALRTLKKATTIQEYRRISSPIGDPDEKGFCKTSTTEWFAFWAIISFIKKIRIRVIVRRVGEDDGVFHFWSVMPFWSLRRRNRVIGSIELEDE